MIDGAERRYNAGWFRTLTEHCTDAIILFAQDNTILYASPSIERITGYSPEEYIGKPAHHLILTEDWEQVAWSRLLTCPGAEISSTAHIRHKDNEWHWIEGTITNLLGDPQIQALMGIYHDITEQKEMRLLASEKKELQQAKDAAECHARSLAATFDAITEGVIVCDAAGKILQSNATARSLLHLDEGEKTAFTFVREQCKKQVPHDLEGNVKSDDGWPLARILRGERLSGKHTAELFCNSPTGQRLLLNISGAPIYNATGTITGAVLVLRDITEQRLLEQQLQLSERKYRALVDSNIVGVTVSDPTGRIYETNDCVAEMFGYTKEELLSGAVSWYQFLAPPYNMETDPIVHAIDSTGATHLQEREHVRKDGSRFPTLVAGTGFDWERRLNIMVFLDISDRKEAEERKQAFLRMISHELRTPLTGVRGFLDLAQFYLQQLPRDYSSEVATTLGIIESMLARADHQAHIENRMVDELLDVSRMEMHKFLLSLKTCDLVALVREIVYQQQIAHHCSFKLLLPAQEQIPVRLDENRIEQVVVNYLTNALRYSPPDRETTVGVMREETVARVFVRDQGPGLTNRQQKYIWEPFYQAETTAPRGDEGGLGLGLYIAKLIIEQHGGQVGVESEPGHGSTFWFTLPLLREEQAKK